MWHGYCFIEVAVPLDNDQKALVKQALLQLGNQTHQYAHKITQFRASNDKQSALLELELTSAVTKAQVCDKLAELLPWTSEQISNNSTFTPSPGNNWEERRQWAVAQLDSNWEPTE